MATGHARARRAPSVLDRPRRHVHRRGGAPARRRARHRQAAVGEPRALPRRGDRGHPPAARRSAPAQPHPGRADRGGEDGHDGRHQRAARAQGRADRAVHHARLPRPAAHRLPEPAAAVRPRTSVCPSCCTAGWSRSTSASARAARCCMPLDEAQLRAALAGAYAAGFRAVAIVFMHGYRYPQHEARVGRARARGRLHAGLGLARGQPADEARLARRHDRGRRLPLADPAALRGPGRRRAQRGGERVPLYFMQSNGGLTERAPLPGQGLDPVRARGRHRRHGAHRAGAPGFDAGHRLRHGRHVHRRLALRRRASPTASAVRHAGGRRAHARADDGDPHHRGGRRLDPALRRPALPRRARLRRREPGPGLLPPRRAADRHRLQRDARQDPARSSSRRCSGRAATSRSIARSWRAKFAALAARDRRARPGSRRRRRQSPRASCASRSPTWPTRSSSSRCSAATT